MLPVDPESDRRRNRGEAGKAVEDRPILQGQIEESRGDRERDHDRIDAFGARREQARQRSEGDGDDDCDRRGDPPRPEQTDRRKRTRAEYGDHVAGDTGYRHLREADHAAITGEKHQRQRDDAEDHRPAEHLNENEVARDRGQKDEYDAEQQNRRVPGCPLRKRAVALDANADRSGLCALQQRHLNVSPAVPEDAAPAR